MKKLIFGKNIVFESCEQWKNEVSSSLALYRDSTEERTDACISILASPPNYEFLSNNPRIYQKLNHGFLANFGHASIAWEKAPNKELRVTAFIRSPHSNSLRGFYRKLRSMEYPTQLEWFEQIIHELVLIPTAHFFPDLAVLHASSISTNNGAVLITGTGGVGKSSALLSTRTEESIGFISDDIIVIDKNGQVYPNFAWPKIYGYNCSDPAILKLLLHGRGLLDKIHFHFKKKINPSSVRRKIRPNLLYSNATPDPKKLREVYFLFRERKSDFELSLFPRQEAIKASCDIMNNEYAAFYKFIAWDQYNSSMLGYEPIITLSEIQDNWCTVLTKALPENTTKLSVPLHISNDEYQNYICTLLNSHS